VDYLHKGGINETWKCDERELGILWRPLVQKGEDFFGTVMIAFFEFTGVLGGQVFAVRVEDDDAGKAVFIGAILCGEVAVVSFIHVDHDDNVFFLEL
jgi:hypothetical protein